MPYNFVDLKSQLTSKDVRGFTLIETIVGIVVLSIAFSSFTTLIYPLANQSAEQVHQIKAAELGQSMINEILGKAFDQNSDMSGGFSRCGDAGASPCTPSSEQGGEIGESRESYNDVDDYNGLITLATSLGDDIAFSEAYIGYAIDVEVITDGNFDGQPDNINNIAKLITVIVTTPQDFKFAFSVYRVNF